MPGELSTPYRWSELLLDRFRGTLNTLVTAHAPDYGGPWADPAGLATKLTGAGAAYPSLARATLWDLACWSPAAPTANAFAQGVVGYVDITGASAGGVVVRATAADTFYALVWYPDLPLVVLAKVIAGADTTLHTYDANPDPGGAVGLQLFAVGDQITAVVDGVPGDPITDAAIAGAGRTGILCNSDVDHDQTQGLNVGAFLAGAAA